MIQDAMGARMMKLVDSYLQSQEKLMNSNFINFVQQQKAWNGKCQLPMSCLSFLKRSEQSSQ